MSETLHENSPNPVLPLAAEVCDIISSQVPNHNDLPATKPKLMPIQSKVLEEANNDDIRLDIEEYPEEQGYFKPDLVTEPAEVEYNKSSKTPHHKKEEAAHVSYFKPKIFFKFLLMHLLFFCLLGPFIIILSPIFGIHVLRNQGFVGFNRGCLSQYFQFGLIVSFILVLYLTETPGLQMMEVYMVFVAILFRMIIISTKYSYQNEWLLELMHTKTLTDKDKRNDLMAARWGRQTDDAIEEEIQSAILNLEIDSPLFFFNFLCQIDPCLKVELSKKEKLRKTTFLAPPDYTEDIIMTSTRLTENGQSPVRMRGIAPKYRNEMQQIDTSPERKDSEVESDIPPSSSRRKSVIVENAIWIQLGQQTQRIFENFVNFFRPQQFESSHLYGYSLLFHLIKTARGVRYKKLNVLCFIVSIIRALLPTFYRIYLIRVEGSDIPVFTQKPYLAVIIFLTNIIFFWLNLIVIVVAIQDIKTKVFCFKQMGYLLSPKKIYHFKEKKLYPTLNIFDPISLKTWSSMRKILTEYGKKYTQRCNLNIGITMIFYIFILTTFVLQVLGIFTAFGDPLVLIVFGYESLIFFTIFVIVMLGSAFLNNQYKVHKNLLKRNKTIISDFQRLSHLYVGPNAIKPDNMVYKEGIKVLRKELGDEDFESKLVERAEKLTGMIDDFIEDLDFQQENEPFKVMGVAMSYELLQSLGLGAVSLIFAIAQSFVN